MRTTKEMENYLLSIGNTKDDMWQLKKAIRECDLELTDNETGEKHKIKNQEAADILGMKTFLSGISRAAFHATCGRESADGKYSVYFNLLKWWK